jgi:hypothetical protein
MVSTYRTNCTETEQICRGQWSIHPTSGIDCLEKSEREEEEEEEEEEKEEY